MGHFVVLAAPLLLLLLWASLVEGTLVRSSSSGSTQLGAAGQRRLGRWLLQGVSDESTVVPTNVGYGTHSQELSSLIVVPDYVPTGLVIQKPQSHSKPSLEECWRACLDTPPCNVFMWCPREGGCTSSITNLTDVPQSGCGLRHQPTSDPSSGRSFIAVEASTFITGAISTVSNSTTEWPGQQDSNPEEGVQLNGTLAEHDSGSHAGREHYVVPQVAGYEQVLFHAFQNRYDYPCSDSLSPGVCLLEGGLEEAAPRCNADPNCQAMIHFPLGRDYFGPNLTLLKGGHVDRCSSNWNINAAAFFKNGAAFAACGSSVTGSSGSSSEGSSLSGGAIAGIVVGACAAALVLLACVIALVRRRQLHQVPAQQQASVAEGPFKESLTTVGSSGQHSAGVGSSGVGSRAAGGSGGLGSDSGGAHPAAQLADLLEQIQQQHNLQEQHNQQQEGAAQGSCQSPPVPYSRRASIEAEAQRMTACGQGRRLSAEGQLQRPSIEGEGVQLQQRLSVDTSTSMPGTPLKRGSSGPAFGQASQASSSLAPEEGSRQGGSSELGPMASVQGLSDSGSALATASMLLPQIPEDTWHNWVLDMGQIEFCTAPDGGLVELGSGAFSVVYKVLLDGVQPHAAKVIDLGADRRSHKVFLEEAVMLRRLRHRNVVGFTGISISKGTGYIVMELMEGKDLFSQLGARNKAGQRHFGWYTRGKRVLLDMARGIHYLHSIHMTHFDIKSSNVLLNRDLTAKLSDVGMARVMSQTHHSISDGRRGTFAYMAPELIAGHKCTEAVDIFSMGQVVWEVCTGEPVRRGMNRELLVPEDCPQAVADLYKECTAEDPAARPTAKELVVRLARLVN